MYYTSNYMIVIINNNIYYKSPLQILKLLNKRVGKLQKILGQYPAYFNFVTKKNFSFVPDPRNNHNSLWFSVEGYSQFYLVVGKKAVSWESHILCWDVTQDVVLQKVVKEITLFFADIFKANQAIYLVTYWQPSIQAHRQILEGASLVDIETQLRNVKLPQRHMAELYKSGQISIGGEMYSLGRLSGYYLENI